MTPSNSAPTSCSHFDVIVLGAGAAGLFCAAEAGKRGRRVLLLDHARRLGEKIRISGGGRCNFTNLHSSPANFLSENPRFCISALKRFTQQDFIARVEDRGIAYHEKTLGQLFCDVSAKDIIQMLLDGCQEAGVQVQDNTTIDRVSHQDGAFLLSTSQGDYRAPSLVVSTGGKSIPKIGATGFGYTLARQFGLKVLDTRPGLVPLTFEGALLDSLKALSGLSVDAVVKTGKTAFQEGLLFTHRGLSGPSILQISSYWREGQAITIDLLPGQDCTAVLKAAKAEHPKQTAANRLSGLLPKRLAQAIAEEILSPAQLTLGLGDLPDKQLRALGERVNRWQVIPSGTEGYRTAEVTLGGVDTKELSSKTFEAKKQPGLYFIGEVVDVTGHLGGFNFQWAWSSGWCAGQVV
ncbi:NAD(P)/FAD-dependent oxidoreductase [Rhodovibrionaceae bacterium A322]